MLIEIFRSANSTDSQLWFISDVGNGELTIASNATGVLLTASISMSLQFLLTFQISHFLIKIFDVQLDRRLSLSTNRLEI